MPFDTAISTGMRGCASHSDFQSEREKMLDEVRMRLSKLKTAYPRGTGADFVWWLVIDTVLKELRLVGEPQYQCGDNCNGECSGEVDGVVHCPEEEHDTEVRDKMLDELKAWCVQTKCNGCPYGGNLFHKIAELQQSNDDGHSPNFRDTTNDGENVDYRGYR